MIEPTCFGFNSQTAVNNYYQQSLSELTPSKIQQKALAEFSLFVEKLKENGVNVITVKSSLKQKTPDAIFPNNWVSFHENGTVALYPMFAPNRRLERRDDIIQLLKTQYNFKITNIQDYSKQEKNNLFLEGTGSLILDRENKICYAAISERTSLNLVLKFCEDFSYSAVYFTAYQTVKNKRLHIYHTNVMLCIADHYAIVCLDAIDNQLERQKIQDSLLKSGKKIIEISENQVNQFAGNMLQVIGDKTYLVMSTRAYNSLNENQKNTISNFNPILHSNLETIEKIGGGSARCMMAEIFCSLF